MESETDKDMCQWNTPLDEMIYRYPQLTLTPKENMSDSEEYKNIVRRGKMPSDLSNLFVTSSEDKLYEEKTMTGKVNVLYLAERSDFERFVQVMAYKCENVEIPASMGAITISNISNWRKIEAHKKEWLKSSNGNWSEEFKKFTAIKSNFKDILVVISKGYYSNLSAEAVGFPHEEWVEASRSIRLYHELSHVVLREKNITERDALAEEAAADAMGLYITYGSYDVTLARKLLGIENGDYRMGGRLQNYVEEGTEILGVVPKMSEVTDRIEKYFEQCTDEYSNIFEILIKMYEDIEILKK